MKHSLLHIYYISYTSYIIHRKREEGKPKAGRINWRAFNLPFKWTYSSYYPAHAQCACSMQPRAACCVLQHAHCALAIPYSLFLFLRQSQSQSQSQVASSNKQQAALTRTAIQVGLRKMVALRTAHCKFHYIDTPTRQGAGYQRCD